MKLEDSGKFAYCIGFIKMLDAYLQNNGATEEQRMIKRTFLIKSSIDMLLPGVDPKEIMDFMDQIDNSKLGDQLISIIQKRIDRDNFMKQLQHDGMTEIFKRYQP